MCAQSLASFFCLGGGGTETPVQIAIPVDRFCMTCQLVIPLQWGRVTKKRIKKHALAMELPDGKRVWFLRGWFHDGEMKQDL